MNNIHIQGMNISVLGEVCEHNLVKIRGTDFYTCRRCHGQFDIDVNGNFKNRQPLEQRFVDESDTFKSKRFSI